MIQHKIVEKEGHNDKKQQRRTYCTIPQCWPPRGGQPGTGPSVQPCASAPGLVGVQTGIWMVSGMGRGGISTGMCVSVWYMV